MALIYLVELDNVWVADQLHDIHLAIYLGNIMTNCQMYLKKNKTINKTTITLISYGTNLG